MLDNPNRQVNLNEFTKTTGKTASLIREVSESPIHLHDLFDPTS